MTHRERFQAALDGREPGQMPWVSRLDIWYNARTATGTLPDDVRGLSLHEIEAMLGMGRSARKAAVFHEEYGGVREQSVRDGDYLTLILDTPKGSVSCKWYEPEAYRAQGITKARVERFVKSPQDYEVLGYVAEHTRFVPDYEAYRTYDAEVGEDGYPLVIIGPSPIHRIMLEYLGYERFYYDLADHPGRIEELLGVLDAKYREMWEVVAQSPAKLVLHGTHFSSAMTPPPIFDKYFAQYFRGFNERMHEAGIKVAFHADADLTGLLERVPDCRFDVADTFACAPLVRTTFEDARAAWDDQVVIWGGIPSIILESDYPASDFRHYMRDLLREVAGQSHVILAVSDNVMPGADLDRLKWIRDQLATRRGS